MKLYLTNFGCYEQRTFEFPDDGIILISGVSGKGKTTIVRAIEFALFGTGNKLVTFGKRKCQVELEFQGLHIMRTKGPCRLVVNYTMEDDEGEQFLNQRFPDRMFFLHQNNRNTFLSLNPAAQLEYLEHLAFQHLDLPGTKKVIKERMRKLELSLAGLQGEIDICEAMTETPVVKPEEVDTVWTVDECTRQKEELQGRLQQLRERQRAYQVYQRTLTEYETRYAMISSQMETVQTRLKMYPDDIQERVDALYELQTVHERWTRYSSLKRQFKEQKKVYDDSIAHETTDLETQVQACDDALSVLDTADAYKSRIRALQRHAQLTRDLDQVSVDGDIDAMVDLETRIDEYLVFLERHLVCPSCSSDLCLVDNTLVDASSAKPPCDNLPSSPDALRALYQQTRDDIAHYRHAQTRREYLEEKLRHVKPKLPTDPLDVLEERLSQVLKQETLRDRYVKDKARVETKFRNMKQQLVRMKQTYRAMEPVDVPETEFDADALCSLTAQLASYKTETRRLNDLKRERDRLVRPEHVDNADDDMSNAELELDHVYRVYDILQRQQEYDTYQAKKVQLERVREKHTTKRDALVCLGRFRELMLKAESIAFANTIQTLNTNVQHYLDAFFTDDSMEVKVALRKTSKTTKVETTQVHLNVYYKNMEVDIGTLSGGEYDRVVLAFALALADMNSSPFIVLDECVGSLDQETTSSVCDFIREQGKGKLVLLIAHQIVTGMFDQIIRLE